MVKEYIATGKTVEAAVEIERNTEFLAEIPGLRWGKILMVKCFATDQEAIHPSLESRYLLILESVSADFSRVAEGELQRHAGIRLLEVLLLQRRKFPCRMAASCACGADVGAVVSNEDSRFNGNGSVRHLAVGRPLLKRIPGINGAARASRAFGHRDSCPDRCFPNPRHGVRSAS